MSAEHRSPVVVVLGHVDHGKTTLLDYIRKSSIASKEAGSITQSIGGYEAVVPVEGYHTQSITFIDTPGHEAFTKLRARGTTVADIAILIVDATASVKPQTIESIEHIQQSDLPYIVAINKVDLQTANPDKVRADLAKHNVLTEGYGGKVPAVEISAQKGTGVNDLLEALLFIAADQELTYDPAADVEAYIIETHQEKAGIEASCIIKNGKLTVGDIVFAGEKEAKIRAMINDRGDRVNEVLPSMPFILLGFKDMPDVGLRITRTKGGESASSVFKKTEEDDPFSTFFEEEAGKKLKIVLKAESQGSLEALIPNLEKNKNVQILLSAVGEISESDIFLAKASKAIVIGFAVNYPKIVEQIAKREKVVVKTYSIIYRLLEELAEVSSLLKEKEERERTFKGEAKIQAVFNIDGAQIAGVKISKGRFDVHDRAELYRGDSIKDEALIVSIKQRAQSVDTAKKGDEAGLQLDPQLDIKQGDVIKSYSI